MDLLNLAPELFEYIMTELVMSTSVEESWKSRAVCRNYILTAEYLRGSLFDRLL